jgi:hypothetical protein
VPPVPGCLTMPKFRDDAYVSSAGSCGEEQGGQERYIDFL